MNEILSKKFALEVDGKKSLQKFLAEEYEKRTFPKSIGFGYIDKDNVEYSAGTFLNWLSKLSRQIHFSQ